MSTRRTLRVVVSGAGGAASALVATVLAPTIEACGASPPVEVMDASRAVAADALAEALADSAQDGTGDGPSFPVDVAGPSAPVLCPTCTYTVQLPEAGTFPDVASVCAAAPPVFSDNAATVSLSGYDPATATSNGLIAIRPDLLAALVGDPVLVISPPILTVGALAKTSSGYSFTATGTPRAEQPIQVTVTLHLACSADSGIDAALQSVTSTTWLELCHSASAPDATPQEPVTWRSSGESCLICCPIVAEMAPTPIMSDGRGDDLPLARAVRLRVVGLAHAGSQVLLVAQNDAGPDAQYEWRVSCGTIERVTDDIVVWTLHENDGASFGQIAVWNDTGAAVENFYWSAA